MGKSVAGFYQHETCSRWFRFFVKLIKFICVSECPLCEWSTDLRVHVPRIVGCIQTCVAELGRKVWIWDTSCGNPPETEKTEGGDWSTCTLV